MGASGVTDDKQKRQLLLHYAGTDVQDIFYTLPNTGETYTTAKEKITAYFTPRKNTSYNRHMFRKDSQTEGESVAQFVTRLRQLANLCEFGDHIDDFIRDQVIDNCRSKRLRTKLLAERDLKLERVLDFAAAMEASERQAAQMAQDAERVNMVSGADWRERQKQPKVNVPVMIQTGVQNVVDGATQLMPVAAHRLLSVTRMARRSTSARCSAVTRNRHSRDTARNTP